MIRTLTIRSGVIFLMLFTLFSVSAAGGATAADGGESIEPYTENLTEAMETSEQRSLNNLTGASSAFKPIVSSVFELGETSAISGLEFGHKYPTFGRAMPAVTILFTLGYGAWAVKRIRRP